MASMGPMKRAGGGMKVAAVASLGLVIARVVLLVTGFRPRTTRRAPDRVALDILEQRYAAGESDEFEGRRGVPRA